MRRSVRVTEDRVALQQELQWCLAKPISEAHLAEEIETLLASVERKIDRRVLAQRLAQAFASQFTHKSNELRRLIKYRPQQLADLAESALFDEVNELIPALTGRKEVPEENHYRGGKDTAHQSGKKPARTVAT